MKQAALNDVTLEYEVTGTGGPVVCIHGALIGDAFRPLRTEPALIPRYRLITYYRRGYLGSTRTASPVSIAQQAADCRTLLRHLGVDGAHVVGHSLGGVIAIQLALDAPDAVHSLVLMEPALMVGESARAYRDSLLQGVQRYREGKPEVVIDEFLQARFGPGYRAELDRILPEAFEQAVADAETSFEFELPPLRDWHFGEAAAQRITQPVLAVIGEQSQALSPRFLESHQALLKWLPNVEGYVLPDAAHGMQMQNPRELAEALVRFFARHPLSPDQPA